MNSIQRILTTAEALDLGDEDITSTGHGAIELGYFY